MTATDAKSTTDEADLVIIGAGPHAMSLVLSLLEDSPKDTYTREQERQMEYWKRKSSAIRSAMKNQSKKRKDKILHKVKVIDPSGAWNVQWNSQFEAFGISHLRSPIITNPDPFNDDGMRVFAHQHNRLNSDTKNIKLFDDTKSSTRERRRGAYKGKRNLMTQGTSMFAENDRQRYVLPSQSLFRDYCTELEARYGISDMVIKNSVVNIEAFNPDDDESTSFKLTLGDGTTINANAVVCAIGTCNIPRSPSWMKAGDSRILHSVDLVKQMRHNTSFCRKSLFCDKRIMVVGGGLTTVHLAAQAIRFGASKVYIVSRKQLVTQQYDVPLSWISRTYRNLEIANHFYESSTPVDRYRAIEKARQGGTVTNESLHELQKVLKNAGDNTELEILCNKEVECLDLSEEEQVVVHFKKDERVCAVDQILVATGTSVDITKEKMFDQFRTQFGNKSAPVFKGLPELSPELRWGRHNLFFMGGYAALQLGPAALNLAGAAQGTSRLREVLLDSVLANDDDDDNAFDVHEEYLDVLCHKTNSFNVLLDDD